MIFSKLGASLTTASLLFSIFCFYMILFLLYSQRSFKEDFLAWDLPSLRKGYLERKDWWREVVALGI